MLVIDVLSVRIFSLPSSCSLNYVWVPHFDETIIENLFDGWMHACMTETSDNAFRSDISYRRLRVQILRSGSIVVSVHNES